jgi:hypothetical protein
MPATIPNIKFIPYLEARGENYRCCYLVCSNGGGGSPPRDGAAHGAGPRAPHGRPGAPHRRPWRARHRGADARERRAQQDRPGEHRAGVG